MDNSVSLTFFLDIPTHIDLEIHVKTCLPSLKLVHPPNPILAISQK
jgi:hypothetical protein